MCIWTAFRLQVAGLLLKISPSLLRRVAAANLPVPGLPSRSGCHPSGNYYLCHRRSCGEDGESQGVESAPLLVTHPPTLAGTVVKKPGGVIGKQRPSGFFDSRLTPRPVSPYWPTVLGNGHQRPHWPLIERLQPRPIPTEAGQGVVLGLPPPAINWRCQDDSASLESFAPLAA